MTNAFKPSLKSPYLRLIAGLGFCCLAVACDQAAAPEQKLQVASRSVSAGALSQGGDLALIGSSFHGGSLWDLEQQARVFNWNHAQGDYSLLTAAGFSPDGDWALTSDGMTLVLWDTNTGEAQHYSRSPAEVLDLALGAEGDFALLGLADRRAELFNAKRGGVVQRLAHAEPVTTVSLSADGRLALTGSDDGTAILWDLISGEALKQQSYDSEIQLVRLSPQGERALSSTRYQGVQIWSSRDESIWSLPLSEERLKRGLRITAARFSEDGDYLLTGRARGLVELWDLNSRSLMYSWRLPKRKAWQPTASVVLDLSFTEDLSRYRALSSDGFVHDLNY